ncbi:glycoside hydrolase family 3 protein [Nitrospirillum amazonense]|uniref:glycoside hydrolase family 3 protein n=1 Tax=Nitrospirillum amazonense TaxID=28077 RepID=UPI0024123929|nr:glycoside hydrolase family 3 N-terminal domain-containing protein [Nitrospirillum amazonense]MDG3439673.1 glycoside hydrolase family 3 N-terminal domain-containing protein [Nitrospirillum amazonense]
MRPTIRLSAAVTLALLLAVPAAGGPPQPALGSRVKPLLEVDGLAFRDLNGNGVLDPYEDWRLPVTARVADLLGRMTVEEKAGTLLHGTAPPEGGFAFATMRGPYDFAAAAHLIRDLAVTTMTTRQIAKPQALAEQNNQLQEIAEGGRLGIPLTLSSDPRHHFQMTAGASIASAGFSQWPEALGLGAIGDAALVRRFGDIARQEYRAVGIHQTLSPMADVATEPRWPRINGTFGEDPDLDRRLVQAYVEGFQGGDDGPGATGVSAIVKHWVGYGAAQDGFDSHNSYGRYSVVRPAQFDLHVLPFKGAFAAHVAGVMPTYSILKDMVVEGRPAEPVGAGFSRWLLTDLLRDTYGFQGIVLSDWAIANDCDQACRGGFPPGTKPTFDGFSTAWGVEDLSAPARFAKGLLAGLDQFGGVDDPAPLLAAVRQGLVAPSRLDQSVRRVLALKFQQGLFENPYVDAAAAAKVVGAPAFKAEGLAAQARAMVLLEAGNGPAPLMGRKVYLRGVSAEVARAAGLTVVDDLKQADVALLRLSAPFQTLHPNYTFGQIQHEGDLGFHDGNADYEVLKAAVAAKVPAVVSVYLDRPAILTDIRDKAARLYVDFGVSDTALLDVVTGKAAPQGHLPVELPRSMAAVAAQASDIPHDSPDPLYPIGMGSAR